MDPDRSSGPIRRLILVAGMHRSGTSALTRALNLCGATIPGEMFEPSDENPDGFWEPRSIVLVHEEILASVGLGWDDTAPFPADWFETARATEYRDRLWHLLRGPDHLLVKDPRICRLLPLWTRMCSERNIDLSIVIPVRDPIDVASSLQARDGMPTDQALLLWLRHMLDAEVHTRGHKRYFVAHEQLMRDSVTTIAALGAAVDLPMSDDAATAIATAIRPAYWHHRGGSRGATHDWAKRVYEWAIGGDRTDFAPMDSVRREMQLAETLYRPEIDRGIAARHKLRHDVEARDDEIATLGATLSSARAVHATLEAERDRLLAERRTLLGERQELRDLRDRLSQSLETAEAGAAQARDALSLKEYEMRTVLNSRSWRFAAPLRWLGRRFLRQS